ncbi:FAD-dependent oxidoreductase [Ottowia thiooxydans]|uniref:FAD-dependent oxidoreductase n=1 Tax=Ottowia thiooxydans TaxID=219182 RepID=UPI0003F8677C|nr:FAD-dependent oxidoreductase [Ottowia thiooxydans]
MTASQHGYVEAPARTLAVLARPDVLVVGGGAAGMAAACAAAREGAEVMLVERQGYLGGTLTSVTLGGLCGGYLHQGGGIRPIVGGLYAEMVDRLKLLGAISPTRVFGFVHGVPYDPEALRGMADAWLTESGVKVLLHAFVTEVSVSERRVRWVEVETRAGRAAILPTTIVDTSGDAEVVFRAGGRFSLGDKGRTQHPSQMFRMSGVDCETFFSVPRPQVDALLQGALNDGEPLPRTSVAVYPNPVAGVAHLNATRVTRADGSSLNLTDPWELTQAEMTGRQQASLYARVARERLPGFGEARIVALGASLGIRETRLVQGDQTLTEPDVMQAHKPADRIACSGWPIEDHATQGRTVWRPLPDGEWYGIPFGCLVSSDFDNVLVAGRCLSATHEAQASARVVATCMAMGEAAGTAATMSLSSPTSVRVDVPALQQKLLAHGALLEPSA